MPAENIAGEDGLATAKTAAELADLRIAGRPRVVRPGGRNGAGVAGATTAGEPADPDSRVRDARGLPRTGRGGTVNGDGTPGRAGLPGELASLDLPAAARPRMIRCGWVNGDGAAVTVTAGAPRDPASLLLAAAAWPRVVRSGSVNGEDGGFATPDPAASLALRAGAGAASPRVVRPGR